MATNDDDSCVRGAHGGDRVRWVGVVFAREQRLRRAHVVLEYERGVDVKRMGAWGSARDKMDEWDWVRVPADGERR